MINFVINFVIDCILVAGLPITDFTTAGFAVVYFAFAYFVFTGFTIVDFIIVNSTIVYRQTVIYLPGLKCSVRI